MQSAWRSSGVIVSFASLLAGLVGCDNASTNAQTKRCEADEAIACITDSGCRGYKHCNQDGSAYGNCDCSLGSSNQAGNASVAAGGANSNQGGALSSFGLGGAGTSSSTTSSGSAMGSAGTTTAAPQGSSGTTAAHTTAVTASAGSGGASAASVVAGGTGSPGGAGGRLSDGTTQLTGGAGTDPARGGSAGIGNSGNTGGTIARAGNGATGGSDGGNGGSGVVRTRRAKQCDAAGQNCKCLNLASFGARASSAYGEDLFDKPTSTTAFEVWLAEKTNATFNMVQTKPNLSAEYLANLDVIILQDLRSWSFSTTELQNLANWVRAGGGLIALNGYFNEDDAEVTASNQALAFSGMSYDGGGVALSVPNGNCPDSSKQLCPQSSGSCCYCWNATMPIQSINPNHPVMKGIKALGAYFGRSINAGDAIVLASYAQDAAMPAKTVAATKAVGLGQVVLWGDEWITYTSQWSGGFTNPSATGDLLRYEPCYNSNQGYWLTADHVFQTKQFWYNLISQVAPPTECDFFVDEPEVIAR